MDEPFVGLDPKMAYLVKETMREVRRRGEHLLLDARLGGAEKLCHRIAIIKQGKIITGRHGKRKG